MRFVFLIVAKKVFQNVVFTFSALIVCVNGASKKIVVPCAKKVRIDAHFEGKREQNLEKIILRKSNMVLNGFFSKL